MGKRVVVIGGGAAGFFCALACAEANPAYEVTIIERSPNLLSKVKISGGGRCNVTHACFDAKQLVKFYPRGEKQLLGPFTRFNSGHTIDWFDTRGVALKTEDDGRMFPVTDNSQTIIDCFLQQAQALGVKIITQLGAEELVPPVQGAKQAQWQIVTNHNKSLFADAVVVTAGSSARVWKMVEALGISTIPPVPSLFTFNIKDERIKGLEGLAVERASVSVLGSKLKAEGPVLITHWGMSGPGILRLSAWGARILAEGGHKFDIEVNYVYPRQYAEVVDTLKLFKQNNPKKTVEGYPMFNVPRRLWERLVLAATGNKAKLNFADLSNKHIEQLAKELSAGRYNVNGKSTYKDEFVTAGGVDLNEIDFKTMQSKKYPGLYFAGEVLDIDAITGGFNFQAAWTTGWVAGVSI